MAKPRPKPEPDPDPKPKRRSPRKPRTNEAAGTRPKGKSARKQPPEDVASATPETTSHPAGGKQQAKSARSTAAELESRVTEILALRLGGAELHDIVLWASAPERNWQVGERQLCNYIALADARIKERFDAKAEHHLARHLMQRRALYAHCMGAGEYRTALAVLQDEAKLEGLYPPTKIAPTNPAGDQEYTGGFTDADRAAALTRLYARLGAAVGQTAGTAPADGQAAPHGSAVG